MLPKVTNNGVKFRNKFIYALTKIHKNASLCTAKLMVLQDDIHRHKYFSKKPILDKKNSKFLL